MGRRKTRPPLQLGTRAMTELFKPARLELYESLQVAGPASVADLARRLGRPPDALYYHVRKLLAIGVIEPLEKRPGGRRGPGRQGAVYAAVPRRVDVALDPGSPRSREAWTEGGAAVLRLGQRDFARALESGEVRPRGARRNLALKRLKVRVNAAQLKQINRQLDALYELLSGHAENTQGDLHAVTVLMTPLEERRPR